MKKITVELSDSDAENFENLKTIMRKTEDVELMILMISFFSKWSNDILKIITSNSLKH